MTLSQFPTRTPDPRSPRLTRAQYELFSPFVRRQAIWLARRSPCRVTVQTLCSYGWAGVLDAIATYSQVGEVSEFESYVEHRVKAAMVEFIALLDEKNKAAKTMANLVHVTIAGLTRTLGRAPTSEEICTGMALDQKQYEEALIFAFDAGVARLYGLDVVNRPGTLEDDEVLARSLTEAIERLEDPLKMLLVLLYQEQCSHDEAARVLDITSRAVKVQHAEAIFRLRTLLGRV